MTINNAVANVMAPETEVTREYLDRVIALNPDLSRAALIACYRRDSERFQVEVDWCIYAGYSQFAIEHNRAMAARFNAVADALESDN